MDPKTLEIHGFWPKALQIHGFYFQRKNVTLPLIEYEVAQFWATFFLSQVHVSEGLTVLWYKLNNADLSSLTYKVEISQNFVAFSEYKNFTTIAQF